MAATRILVIGDTHARAWAEVHPAVRAAVEEADIAVHCGDIVRMAVVEGFRAAARRAVVVCGNSDPPDLWRALPAKEHFEVDGVRIGVTHPIWGAAEFEPARLLPDFTERGAHTADVICYGHLHEPVNETVGGVLFVNGGQAYPSFLVPATVAWLTVEDGLASAEIVEIAPAE
ncbi:MAG: metallophosphoesterase family protein [Dehalococcoidia bacterium]